MSKEDWADKNISLVLCDKRLTCGLSTIKNNDTAKKNIGRAIHLPSNKFLLNTATIIIKAHPNAVTHQTEEKFIKNNITAEKNITAPNKILCHLFAKIIIAIINGKITAAKIPMAETLPIVLKETLLAKLKGII